MALKVLNQPNQNGGLNVRTHPSLIRDSQLSNAYNNKFAILGEVSHRMGYEKVFNEISAVNPSLGLGRYKKQSTGVEYLVIKVNGQFRYVTPLSTSWSILASGYSTTISDFGDHTVSLGKMYIANEIDPLLEFDGATLTPLTSFPRGRFCCVYKGRIFIAGVPANPSRVYWSNLEANTFSSGNYQDLQLDDGFDITGIKISEGKIRAYKGKGGSFSVNYTDAGVPFFTRDDTFEGALRHQTIASIEGPAIYLASKSVRRMGQKPNYPSSQKDDDISDPISPIFKNMNSAVATGTACGAYFDGEYYLAIPVGSSTVNNALLVYTERQRTQDYPFGAWAIWTNIYANALVEWNGYLHFCDSRKGQLYRFNPAIKTDDGTAIESVLTTKAQSCGKPNIKKRFHSVNVRCFIEAGGVLNVSYSKDFGSFSGPIAVTPSSSGGSPGDPLGIISGEPYTAESYGDSSMAYGFSTAVYAGAGGASDIPIFCQFKFQIDDADATYLSLRFQFATPNKSWKLIDYDIEYEELPPGNWEPLNCSLDFPPS